MYNSIARKGQGRNSLAESGGRASGGVKEINTLSAASSKAALEAAAKAFDEITGVLGLMYNRKKDEVPAEVTELVEKRAAAKKAKDWAAADAIRAQLTEMGWAVKDTAQGPQLSKI